VEKKLTPKEAAEQFEALCQKYKDELQDLHEQIVVEAQTMGFITPATNKRRRALIRKIKTENGMSNAATRKWNDYR